MEYRPLGNTGIRVSEIGFGSWTIGGPVESGGVPVGWSGTTDQESLATVRRAIELGVTFFDTADIYGNGRSESLLGLALSRRRPEFVIATKVGLARSSSGELRKDFSKSHVFHAIDGSLKRLRTDYVDLYQLHNPTLQDLERGEIQEAMEMLQSLGKIRYWGVSITEPEEGLTIIRNRWGYTLQVLYNILNQAPSAELFPLAEEHGFGIIARVPLASGLLTGKFRNDSVLPPDDIRQNFLTPRRLHEALERVDTARGVVGGMARTMAEAALRFVLAQTAVSTTIPGARTPHQVEVNTSASGERLPDEVVRRLQELLADYNFYSRHNIRV